MIYWGHHIGGWGYALMAFSSIVFWALLILAVVVGVRMVRHYRSGPGLTDRPTPEQLLAERYARGEIDDEEYRHRLTTLTGGPRPATRP